MAKYHMYTCACALKCGNKLWISQRILTETFAGFWQFPGGKCEDNENPIDAIVRELKEETNLDIVTHRLYFLGNVTGDPSTKICFVYYVELRDDEIPVRKENLSSDWVLLSYDEVLQKHLMPGTAELVYRLKNKK